jgi:tRNA-splicing ligase RtcB (3'-phosphate/5'-hydroxy nucleic acid ligase)
MRREAAMKNVDGYKLLNFGSQIDDGTIEQAKETAAMPFVHPHVALMPDAHVGKGSAVGTVIPTLGAVIPAAVGVDIGCGMIAARTKYSKDAIAGLPLAELRSSIEDAIPMSKGGYNNRVDRFDFTAARIESLEHQAESSGVELKHSPNWRLQLGTLGGGNHFIELCLDNNDDVWMFLHSGSRGVGNKIANRHIKIAQKLMAQFWIQLPNPDLAYLPQGTREFDSYITELKWAQAFALANRAEMMDRFRQVLAEHMDDDPADIEVDRITCHHNYTTVESHGGKDVWVTRKGAVNAAEGARAIIPGSMGTRSYVVTGLGNKAGLCSAPHGAGRRFSRAEARRRFTGDDLAVAMQGIEYRHGDAWIDEIPSAYKDIELVMKDARELVSIDFELRQILNVKGE